MNVRGFQLHQVQLSYQPPHMAGEGGKGQSILDHELVIHTPPDHEQFCYLIALGPGKASQCLWQCCSDGRISEQCICDGPLQYGLLIHSSCGIGYVKVKRTTHLRSTQTYIAARA